MALASTNLPVLTIIKSGHNITLLDADDLVEIMAGCEEHEITEPMDEARYFVPGERFLTLLAKTPLPDWVDGATGSITARWEDGAEIACKGTMNLDQRGGVTIRGGKLPKVR